MVARIATVAFQGIDVLDIDVQVQIAAGAGNSAPAPRVDGWSGTDHRAADPREDLP